MRQLFLLVILIIVICHGQLSIANARTRKGPPVIIIPGTGASIIEAEVKRASDDGSGCPRHKDWFRAWLNVKEMFPTRLPCLINDLRLTFDPETNISSAPAGTRTRVVGFGTASSVEYMDHSWLAYFLFNIGTNAAALIKRLLHLGYERDVSIRGAPYDFRFSMGSDVNYFQRLKLLVEETYHLNGDSPVSLISHSMGGLYSVWFLNQQTKEWKDKFIDSCITVSAPWGGSAASLLSVTSGYNLHINFVDPLVVRKAQVTYESTYLMLPSPLIWSKPLVYTDDRNYTMTANDVSDMLETLRGSSQLYRHVMEINSLTRPSVMPPHPGVPTFCLHGAGISTENELHFEGRNFADEQPKVVFTDGDGTVSRESLSACNQWQGDTVHVQKEGVTHGAMWLTERGVDEILNALFRK
uniref:Group XV phospholipase A2-like n=1 Tax=Phallusia mammillata TaxID=59560 RepID=A0A6F9DPU2_9ASCI|nr:group XV phospholipase A2-like [Phallusia mammillata]